MRQTYAIYGSTELHMRILAILYGCMLGGQCVIIHQCVIRFVSYDTICDMILYGCMVTKQCAMRALCYGTTWV